MNKVGPMFLLFLLFLGLKLAGVITWSWWWVTAPLWGGVALIVLALVIYCLIYVSELPRNR